MLKATAATALALAVGTMALAHTGVQNPAVMERMEAMKSIGESMEVIGTMAKGERPFDADAADAAARAIARHAAETPALFEAREDDPESEALPAIWEDFDDFTEKALELEATAREVAGSVETQADLREAVATLGAACKACHSEYRE